MKNRVKWLMMTLAATGIAGGAVMAQEATSSSGAAAADGNGTTVLAQHHWRHHDMMMGGGLVRAFHQLNLTDAQKQSVKSLLTNAHEQALAAHKVGGGPDFAALSNPGDPNHAAALQALQTRMQERMQQQTALQQQLYDVLTPGQKEQLPQVLASMKARMAQRAGGAA